MATMTGTNESLVDIRTAISSIIPGSLATTVIKLFMNDVTPGLGTKVADLTEATFTGYAAVPVTGWDATQLDPATGLPIIVQQTPAIAGFPQTGTTIVNTIFGFWVELNGHILLAERFDNPIQMDTTGKNINLTLRVFMNVLFGPDGFED